MLHLSAKFRRNRTIGGGVITSYRFFKMAAIDSEVYFRVQVYWLHLFKKVEIYLRAKFRWDISIHGWDKTTSVLENERPPYWNFISGHDFCLNVVFGVSFCIGLQNFVKIELPSAELWRHVHFFKMAAGSHIGLDLVNIGPPMTCKCWSRVGPQIWSRYDL